MNDAHTKITKLILESFQEKFLMGLQKFKKKKRKLILKSFKD